jgi:glycerol-3-phosphate acyltransferase PlsY
MSKYVVYTSVGLASYLLGAVPFCLLLGFLFGTDIRNFGSGNTGATNLARVVNYPVGIFGLLLDFLKGFAPAFAGAAVCVWFIGDLPEQTMVLLNVMCGFLSIMGHCFPVYLGFDGGKGVATSLGVFLAIMPIATAGTFLVWLVVALGSGWVSLASILSAAALPFVYLLTRFVITCRGCTFFIPELILALLASTLVIVRHKTNIVRLINGEERKFMDSAVVLDEEETTS